MHFITPDCFFPDNIKAYTTTRSIGVSEKPFDSFNLADHVGDNPGHVERNRLILNHKLKLPRDPVWLKQQHGTDIVNLDNFNTDQNNNLADGSITTKPGVVCAVLTADCLPILICDQQGKKVSAVHAGWKGLLKGIIPNAINLFNESPATLLVWLGPCISVANYQVGFDLYQQFIQRDQQYGNAFYEKEEKLFCDLKRIARIQLSALGINNVFSAAHCTYEQKKIFYSYRRDGKTGRMASLIWRLY